MSRKLNSTERYVMVLVRQAARTGRNTWQGQNVPRHTTVRAIRDAIWERYGIGGHGIFKEQDVRKILDRMQRKGAPVCTTEYGVRLAVHKRDIVAQAMRLKRHGLSELRHAAQLLNMRLFDRLAGQIDARFERRAA